jgi:hypothetical protein
MAAAYSHRGLIGFQQEHAAGVDGAVLGVLNYGADFISDLARYAGAPQAGSGRLAPSVGRSVAEQYPWHGLDPVDVPVKSPREINSQAGLRRDG